MTTRRGRSQVEGQPMEENDVTCSGSIIHVTEKAVHEICDLRSQIAQSPSEESTIAVGVVLVYGSWNKLNMPRVRTLLARLAESVILQQGLECSPFCSAVQVDQSDESIRLCLGETEEILGNNTTSLPLPPAELPVLAIVVQKRSMERSSLRYVSSVRSTDLIRSCVNNDELGSDDCFYASQILRRVQSTVEEVELEFGIGANVMQAGANALRIFVAGDRSSAGKSSVCLGILGNLVAAGYAPETLAYIKPATQSESTQLIQLYCEQQGIQCVPVGPVVYYRGFTRAFLAGETASTAELLDMCGDAVDRVARGKKVVLVDGVGFPAVGSICGTSNAAVARACGYPVAVALPGDDNGNKSTTTTTTTRSRKPMGVVLVGGSGVGAAVDAFNLNATYFEQAGVPVLGGIFNKLSETGFYSLENCKAQVTAYFDQSEEHIRKGRRPFGFVPLFPKITGKHAMDHVDEYFKVFGAHVDITAILDSGQRVKESPTSTAQMIAEQSGHMHMRRKLEVADSNDKLPKRSRQELEALAIAAGAAPSA